MCEKCQDTGVVIEYDDPGASPSECGLPSVKLENRWDCPDCVGKGICPICGSALDEHNACTNNPDDCGWEQEPTTISFGTINGVSGQIVNGPDGQPMVRSNA